MELAEVHELVGQCPGQNSMQLVALRRLSPWFGLIEARLTVSKGDPEIHSHTENSPSKNAHFPHYTRDDTNSPRPHSQRRTLMQ